MYIMEGMIDMGLPKGIEWPSKYHRQVAINLLIANPQVNRMELLESGVTNVLNIPHDKIQTITFEDLNKYGFNCGISVSPVV